MKTEYQKIASLYHFDSETRTYTNEFSSPELEALRDVEWLFTEKVDGTNIRIIWDGYRVEIKGRSDNAQIPPALLSHLQGLFSGADNEKLFEQKFGVANVVLYGEGYGGKVQKGGRYRPDESFVLFDVRIEGLWLRRPDIEDVALYFGLLAVPVILQGSLWAGISRVEAGFQSTWNDQFEAEGLVGVTAAGLLDRRGNRIAIKIKARDFK